MKKTVVLLLLAAAAYWAWTSPTAGAWIYANASDAEASLYGLEQKRIDIGELEMEAYIGGPEDRPAIVMIHGFSADKDNWPRLAKHFIDDFRVIAPDLAGHGDTGFDPNWDYSGPAQAKRVALLLDKLNVKSAHIIGNSMGGFITGWFARLYPERTLSATPVDPAGVPSPEPSNMDKQMAAGSNPFLIETPAHFQRFYPMTMAKPPFLPPSVLSALGEQYIERKPELDAIFAQIHQRDDLTNELAKVNAPALVVWGDQDQLIHVSAANEWAKRMPNSRMHIFAGIGHMPMLEVPAELAQVYRQFIEGI